MPKFWYSFKKRFFKTNLLFKKNYSVYFQNLLFNSVGPDPNIMYLDPEYSYQLKRILTSAEDPTCQYFCSPPVSGPDRNIININTTRTG